MENVIVATAAQAAEVWEGDDAGGEPLWSKAKEAGSVHQELGARSSRVDGGVTIQGANQQLQGPAWSKEIKVLIRRLTLTVTKNKLPNYILTT